MKRKNSIRPFRLNQSIAFCSCQMRHLLSFFIHCRRSRLKTIFLFFQFIIRRFCIDADEHNSILRWVRQKLRARVKFNNSNERKEKHSKSLCRMAMRTTRKKNAFLFSLLKVSFSFRESFQFGRFVKRFFVPFFNSRLIFESDKMTKRKRCHRVVAARLFVSPRNCAIANITIERNSVAGSPKTNETLKAIAKQLNIAQETRSENLISFSLISFGRLQCFLYAPHSHFPSAILH